MRPWQTGENGCVVLISKSIPEYIALISDIILSCLLGRISIPDRTPIRDREILDS